MHISLAAETIFTLFGLPITNSLIMTWLAMLVILVIGSLAAARPTVIPSKLQNLVEAVLEFFANLANSVLQDRNLTRRVFPLTCTFFLLIVISNWLGLIPGVGTIGYFHELHGQSLLTPLLRPTNADINSTLSWAIISVIATQVLGIATLGFFAHMGKFLNFRGPIDFFVGILEAFSEVAKLISFSFRLFGNVFAGEVLLTVIAFLVPFIVPLPFYFLELFVGLIQGLVFSMLTLVFIKVATLAHNHEPEHLEPISQELAK